jgi:hypothetical protein
VRKETVSGITVEAQEITVDWAFRDNLIISIILKMNNFDSISNQSRTTISRASVSSEDFVFDLQAKYRPLKVGVLSRKT